MYSAANYQDALLALLPRGSAWNVEESGELSNLMQALAQEFARIDARATSLLLESLPSQTDGLLDEWEHDYGLPDSCASDTQTIAERKATLQQKYIIYGSQSREFLQELALALGLDITITEYKHRRFGDSFGLPWVGDAWNFVIQIDANIVEEEEVSLTARFECVLSKLVHAHKVVIFNYGVRMTEGDNYRITEAGYYRAGE